MFITYIIFVVNGAPTVGCDSGFHGSGTERLMPSKAKTAGSRAYEPPRTISRHDYLRSGRDEWFREVIYTTVQALGRLLACRDAFGRAIELTASQFTVLMGTAHRQKRHGVSIGDLARHISQAPTHVTTEVGRLIRAGYLVKRPNPGDGRSVLVSLSVRGEEAVARVAPLVRSVNDLLFTDIPAQELRAAAAVMHRIALNSEFAMAEIRNRAATRRTPTQAKSASGRR
jgi:DNA-binding MarR family transcriptional regulator